MSAVKRAVIFDFYGTLAHWRDTHSSGYTDVFAAHGYALPDNVLDAYFTRWDGVEHAAHSVSESSYEVWVRHRLCELTSACAVPPSDEKLIIDDLRAADHGPMVAYPEAAATLRALREGGFAIGVCSNWGWELDSFLRQVDLFELVDVAVTSARVGARKPHPLIYARSADALGVEMGEVVFVGDSWAPDVEGPHQSGMTAVHLWRDEERPGQREPELPTGVHRIASLTDLIALLKLG
jgi:putative hydrolase of the HAD superfamily